MEQAYTTIIHETMPGKGTLDYQKILVMVERLGTDMPLFVEHLPDYESYRQAAAYVRSQAESAGIFENSEGASMRDMGVDNFPRWQAECE